MLRVHITNYFIHYFFFELVPKEFSQNLKKIKNWKSVAEFSRLTHDVHLFQFQTAKTLKTETF